MLIFSSKKQIPGIRSSVFVFLQTKIRYFKTEVNEVTGRFFALSRCAPILERSSASMSLAVQNPVYLNPKQNND